MSPNGVMSRKRSYSDFTTKYPNFVHAFRRAIQCYECETSVSNSRIKNYTIFLEPFMSYPMVLHLSRATRTEILVDPRHWATAFMKSELKEIALVLTRAVFTQEDIAYRKKYGAQCGHTSIKELVIKRAAKWMMNKKQDPWSFQYKTDGKGRWPTKEEENTAIEEAFEEVTQKGDIYPITVFVNGAEDFESATRDAPLTDHEIEEKLEQIALAPSFEENDFDFNRIFREFMKLRILGNAASTAKQLTYILNDTLTPDDIPLSHVFVDAIQFAIPRWLSTAKILLRQPTAQPEIIVREMAEKLFKNYLNWNRRNFYLSLDEICPVWRLSIIRGVMWLKKNALELDLDEIHCFDSANPDHNVGFSSDDVRNIEAVFMKYVHSAEENTQVTFHSGYVNQPPFAIGGSSTNDSNTLPAVGTNLQQMYMQEGSEVIRVFSEAELSEFQIELEQLAGEVQFKCLASGLPYMDISSPGSSTSSNIVTTTDDVINEDGTNQQEMIPTEMNNMIVPPSNPIQNSSDFGINNNMETIYPRVEARIENGVQVQKVIIGNFEVKRTSWNAAFEMLRIPSNEEIVEAGKYLFNDVFSTEECETQSWSGKKKNGKKLNESKKKGIVESLAIMKTLVLNHVELPTSGLEMTGITVPKLLKKTILDLLKQPVFIDLRNQRDKSKPITDQQVNGQ